MKKTIMIGAMAVAMLASAGSGYATFAVSENATVGNSTKEVTVGEVDETVYSVEIDWGDMAFDWKYDEKTNEFNFEPHYNVSCYAVGIIPDGRPWIEHQQSIGKLFTDDTCNTKVTLEVSDGVTYYHEMSTTKSRIFVDDATQNGKIKVTAGFTPEVDYMWVNGVFGEYNDGYLGPDVESVEPHFVTYDEGILGLYGYGRYYGELMLTKNSNYAPLAVNVSANDKIGTVTLVIEPDVD